MCALIGTLRKNYKPDFIQFRNVYSSKDTFKQIIHTLGKIFFKHIFQRGLISRIHNEITVMQLYDNPVDNKQNT